MKQKNYKCDPVLPDLFSDHELEPDEHALFSAHLRNCPSCQKSLRENQAISGLFIASLNNVVAPMDDLEEKILNRIRHPVSGFRSRLSNIKHQISNIEFQVSSFKHQVSNIKIAAVAAALVFLVFSFIANMKESPVPAAGPSAIVRSFTGNISSVIITETPTSRHTIIWFNETPTPEGEKDEVGKNDYKLILGYSDMGNFRKNGPGRT